MPIPADLIVRVHPSVINPGGSSLEFNGLLLSKNGLIPVMPPTGTDAIPGILQFGSAEDVGGFFGYGSDEYAFALVYFTGPDNATRRPNTLFIGRRIDTDIAPFAISGQVTRMSAFTGLDAGEFSADFSGTTVTITPLNVTAATSFSEVAQLLQAAIQAATAAPPAAATATVEYNSTLKAFVLTGGTAGDGQDITNVTGTLATAMGFGAATFSIGAAPETDAQTMDRLNSVTANWVTFSSIWEMTDDEAIAYGDWMGQYPVRYVGFPWRPDPHATVSGDDQDLVSTLRSLGMEGMCPVYYPDFRLAALAMGAVASTNFNAIQGARTYAFTRQTGFVPNVTERGPATILISKGWNFYGNYATANDRFIFFYQGALTGQKWLFLDTYVNAIWLNNELQLAAMRTLTTIPKIPYNEDGYTFIRVGLNDPLKAASGKQGNGVIDVGVALSDLQRAAVIREAGMDITPDLYMYGFYLMVRDPSPEDRANRKSPLIWVWYCSGGSVHQLDISSAALA